MKVVRCGEVQTFRSEKTESGQLRKRLLVLQDMGGRYANQYASYLLGNDAECTFYPGELVAATLRFQVREHNEQTYQDTLVTDILKIK